MASVFLSYDREDATRARSIAQALEKAGHSVWWDRDIAGGAQYGTEIEEALKRSDAVVVLWSAAAVRSAWVRDEAAAGRDAGKLVPVRLDSADPPMGFRQYQTIDLSQWKGRRGAEAFDELKRAINGLATHHPQPSSIGGPAVPSERGHWPRQGLLAAAIVLAIVLGGGIATRLVHSPNIPTVAVTAADSSASSQQLARDLYVKLGLLQALDTKPIELMDQDGKKNPDFSIQIAGSMAGSQAHASITLAGRNRALLWSMDFDRPANQLGDLKQQIGLSAARVLECATEAISFGKLDQPTLKMYLNGCATLSELAWNDFRSLIPVFRQVTKKAPEFEGGWTHLLLTEAYMIGWGSISRDSPEADTLRKDIAQARRRYPQIPAAYWAEYLLSIRDLPQKARIIDRATEAHPDHPLILSVQSGFLYSVGRLGEAVEKAKRAADLSPMSPARVSQYINVLGWAGKAALAQAELDKAERMWPGARNLIDARWRHHLRYGDPNEALKITRSGVSSGYAAQESYLLARIDPSPANIERAVADAEARIGREPRATSMLIQTLAEFGRDEELFSILDGPRNEDIGEFGIDVFFRPVFHRIRHDLRFMRVAQKYGLLDYWRKSGKWPDFCFEPGLPYDCKAEAAKIT